ncbi:MAG: HlyD family efflux transporter periplasmic adaptor subunit, partial [Magnetococcales bacterium]|nr:HlyD family efflux transporter periplasmic adaptor subunit [Magnetococcales bacterium]
INRRAPYIVWLTRVLNPISKHHHKMPFCFTANDIKGEDGEAWEQWLPAHAIWVPLNTGLDERLGGLMLVKSTPWADPEIKLISKLAGSYANAWELINKRSRMKGIPWRVWFSSHQMRIKLAIVLLLFLVCWFPVQQSALAPSTVVARDPTPVRAPLDGTLNAFHVTPNQMVKKGDLLFTLDAAVLNNKLEVENRTFDLIQQEYRQVLKQAVTDPESRIQKAVLENRLKKQFAEANGVRILLDRVQVLATRDGTAIFEDVHHWLGKPVPLGERILEVADPNAAELEIRLPVSDILVIETDAQVTLYPNMDPLTTWSGSVTRIAYEAQEMEGVLSYLIKARFQADVPPPRIGLRGTAKIQGRRTTLFYYLFRHPLARMRQQLGL